MKICPMMSKPIATSMNDFTPNVIVGEEKEVQCAQGKCAWWVNGYTTENAPVSCCAMEFIAMKNPASGLYQV
jgi:hypothetical protein